MKTTIHDLRQGSPEWSQFRATHFGASEAAAMLGLSAHMTRTDLLRLKASGIAPERSEWVEANILANGHRVEASIRPHIESVIGDDLYPVTCSRIGSKLSASCDGLTLEGETAWENKQWNADLAEAVKRGAVPDSHMPQCQQILMVTGALRVIFSITDGTPESTVHTEVRPDPQWFERIERGWAQFEADLAGYAPAESAPAPVARAIEALPALVISVEGRVVSSNLAPFREAAGAFLANIKTELATDQDFADAERTVKFCKEGEDRLELVKQQALAQTASIDELFRTVDHIREEMRAKRLTLEKLVKSRKEQIRAEIVEGGQKALDEHRAALNSRLGHPWVPRTFGAFADAIKGKKTVDSIKDAVSVTLANAKIELSALADRLDANRKRLTVDGQDWIFLFADFATIGAKAVEDFAAIAAQRIREHQAAETKAAADRAERARLAEEQATGHRALASLKKAEDAGADPELVKSLTNLTTSVLADSVIESAKLTSAPPINLSEIAKRLGFSLTADFITGTLRIPYSHKERASTYWLASDWPNLRAALLRHVATCGPDVMVDGREAA